MPETHSSLPLLQRMVARGWIATVRAAISAGSVCGLCFGTLDAVVAGLHGTAQLGFLSFLGCLAAAVFQYSLLWVAALVVAGLALHLMLVRKPLPQRYLALLRIGLSLGVFCELYWWTRPYVFYGRSAVSPERLVATGLTLALAFVIALLLARWIVRGGHAIQAAIAAAIVVAWVGGIGFLFAQGGASAARGMHNARNRDMPNVVLIIVDALRRDVLGCYGNTLVKTPACDALAASGVLFEDAHVQAPFTWPSFGSILTGKYPRRHGLVKMAPGYRMVPNVTLPLHLKTATKNDGARLEDGDYLGATFHTGTLSTGSGLLQGFDMYFEAMAGHELVTLDNPWSVFRSDLLLSIFKNKITQRFDSGIVASAATTWLGTHADKRLVTMIHLYSTHTPYDPPERFRKQYVDPGYKGPLHAFYAQHREAIERGEVTPTPADVAMIRALYYAGASHADAMIGDIVAELERKGIRDDTLIIVTGDHGESLGEQGLWEHDHMVQTNLRVPLIMSWPKGLPKGKRVSASTDEIDIFPTVCELAGVALPQVRDEKFDRVDGASMMPLVRGEKDALREFSFAESGTHMSIQDRRSKLIVRNDVMDEKAWTAALAGKGERPRYFDLEHDPDEDHDLITERTADALKLFTALRAWDKTMPIPRMELSARDLENQRLRFQALGYTGEGIGADVDTQHDAAQHDAAAPHDAAASQKKDAHASPQSLPKAPVPQ